LWTLTLLLRVCAHVIAQPLLTAIPAGPEASARNQADAGSAGRVSGQRRPGRPLDRPSPAGSDHALEMAGLQAHDKAPVRDHFLVEGGWVLLAVKSRVNRPQLSAGLVAGG
jgi:hypothetical protein